MGACLTSLCLNSRCTVGLEDISQQLSRIEQTNIIQDEKLKLFANQLSRLEDRLERLFNNEKFSSINE